MMTSHNVTRRMSARVEKGQLVVDFGGRDRRAWPLDELRQSPPRLVKEAK